MVSTKYRQLSTSLTSQSSKYNWMAPGARITDPIILISIIMYNTMWTDFDDVQFFSHIFEKLAALLCLWGTIVKGYHKVMVDVK